MLAKDVRVADRDHIVENSVYDEARLMYLAELREAFSAEAFPGAKGRNLCHRYVCACKRYAVFFSLCQPACEGLACRLTRLAWREEESHELFQPRDVGIFRNLPQLRLLHVHDVLPSLGSRADEHHFVDQRGAL